MPYFQTAQAQRGKAFLRTSLVSTFPGSLLSAHNCTLLLQLAAGVLCLHSLVPNTDVTSPDLSLAVAKRCEGGGETQRARISGHGETRFEWNVGPTQIGSEITNDLHEFDDVI